MNELDLQSLFAEVENILHEAARPPVESEPSPGRGLAFWRNRPWISAAEIDLLATLADNPLRAETVAHVLGQDLVATQDFLGALVAIGVLEKEGDYYQATMATKRYLQTLRDRPPV